MSKVEETRQASLWAFAMRWVVAAGAFAGLVVALVVFGLKPSVFQSQTVVSVTNSSGTMGDELAFIESDRVLGATLAALDFTPEIGVASNENARLVTITARANTAENAALAATQVAETYQQAQTAAATSIAQPALPNERAVAPSMMAHVLLGSLLGAMAGGLVFGLMRLGDPPAESGAAPAGFSGETGPESAAPIRPARRRSDLAQQLVDAREADEPGSRQQTPRSDRRDPVEAGSVRPATPATIDPPPTRPSVFSDAAMLRSTPVSADPERDAMASESRPAVLIDLSDTTQPDRSSRPRPRAARAVATAPDAERSEPTAAGAPPTDPLSTRSTDEELTPVTTVDDPTQADEITVAVEAAVAAADARLEARLAEQRAADEKKLASIEGHYTRQVDELKREISEARKQSRAAIARLKRVDGTDQHRIGDLEAQATALEAEISTLRSQVESERINHLRELAEERDAADQALDKARREHREQLAAHDESSRNALVANRTDFDDRLAEARTEHENALDRQHREHEAKLTAERDRRHADMTKLTQRHREEIQVLADRRAEFEAQIKRQTKDTLASLRHRVSELTDDLEASKSAERTHRGEVSQLRVQLREAEEAASKEAQRLRDDLATIRKTLATEQSRSAALREDVLRRTAEAHQAVDRAIDERSAQLTELEALMTRQREHADQRIRQVESEAETRLREAADREVELQARVRQLEHQLGPRSVPDAGSSSQSSQTG